MSFHWENSNPFVTLFIFCLFVCLLHRDVVLLGKHIYLCFDIIYDTYLNNNVFRKRCDGNMLMSFLMQSFDIGDMCKANIPEENRSNMSACTVSNETVLFCLIAHATQCMMYTVGLS